MKTTMKNFAAALALGCFAASGAAYAANAPTVEDAHAFIKKWIEQGGVSAYWKFTPYTAYQSTEKCQSQFTFEINSAHERCSEMRDTCREVAAKEFGSDKSRVVKVSWANVSDIKKSEGNAVKISIIDEGKVKPREETFVAVDDTAATRASKAFTLLKNSCTDASAAKFD